jgi:asparagine synthase (glutamine-hydrolysing)
MAAREAMPDICVSVSGDSVTLEGSGTASSADRGLLAAICGVPRWSVDGSVDASDSAARLLRRYESRGADLLDELSGTFALCIVDRARNRIIAAADRLGVQRIHYECGPDGVRIASSLAALVKSRGHAPGLDPQALYDYVYFHMIPAPRTIYAGIRTLRRAELLTIDHLSATTRRYWRPDWSPEVVEGVAAYEQTRVLLRRAVERSLDTDPSGAACFLSGGLDSSSVAGTAAGVVAPRAMPAFSIGFDEAAYDESEYARAAAERFGLDWHRHELTADELLESLPAVVASTDQPFGNSSALAVYHCARVAREHGFRRMLAGDGGDEIFGGNSRYEKQLLFERFAGLPLGVRTAVVAPVVSALSAVPGLAVARKLDSFVRQANVALPDRLQSYNYLHRHEPREVFTPRLLAHLDTEEPLDLLRAEFADTGDPHPVNRMLHLDWQFTLQDNDLVKVNSMCRHAGIEVAYPMLDDELVQFSCHVAATDKVRRGDLRRFYRRAMRGFLPDAVIDKKKHGFGLPFGVWTRSHAGLHRLASTSIDALKARRIFEPAFLDRVLSLHRDVHAAYYGELVWILMVLELWFQHRLPDAAGA